MPWKEVSTMSLRREFVSLAMREEANIRSLCRRFCISPKTGYKWLKRFREGGVDALADLSRRPHHSPKHSGQAVEQAILGRREQHPAWGPRKLRALLPEANRPAVSTVAAILKRNGCIDPGEAPKHHAWQRFEAPAPNFLWQMDFKGHFPLSNGTRCHPLTVLDDHSRFLMGLRACANETEQTVRDQLQAIFQCYGLPQRILCDNGSPWGSDQEHPYTSLIAWLIRLGISFSHSRPRHPQTMGKDERLHRSLKSEVISRNCFQDMPDSQRHFDRWRDSYNWERPHEALALAVPATRYQPSPREFPKELPAIEYGPGYAVRRVQDKGRISFRSRIWKVSNAFTGYPVGIHPTTTDGLFDVYFCHQCVTQINLKDLAGDQ